MWKWQPTTVFFPGKPHGQKSLTGYSSWSLKETDMTEATEHTPRTFDALSLGDVMLLFWDQTLE